MNVLRNLVKKPRAAPSTEDDREEVASEEEEAELTLQEQRLAFQREEQRKVLAAQEIDQEYTAKPLPEHLRPENFEAEKEEELEAKRIAHEREENLRKAEQGESYVERPFEAEVATDDDPPPAPAPPPADMEGNLAEFFGAQAYGDAAQSGVGSADMLASHYTQQAPVRRKLGWAGIFDRSAGVAPPPNPFAGPVILPQQMYAPQMMQTGAVTELGIPVHVQWRLDEGRGLATLALGNHESAVQLQAQGKTAEASAAYQAANAGYEQALKILMPIRKDLQEGTQSSRPARTREGDRLQKLITTILDHWESLKPHLIPSVPSGGGPGEGARTEQPARDPLMDRFEAGFAKMGIDDAPPAGPAVSVFTATGELNPAALPSIPTHDVEVAPTWDTPKTGGPKKCFLCLNKSAELMSPCEHFFCETCADQMFSLIPDKCPQCQRECRMSDLKAIA